MNSARTNEHRRHDQERQPVEPARGEALTTAPTLGAGSRDGSASCARRSRDAPKISTRVAVGARAATRVAASSRLSERKTRSAPAAVRGRSRRTRGRGTRPRSPSPASPAVRGGDRDRRDGSRRRPRRPADRRAATVPSSASPPPRPRRARRRPRSTSPVEEVAEAHELARRRDGPGRA